MQNTVVCKMKFKILQNTMPLPVEIVFHSESGNLYNCVPALFYHTKSPHKTVRISEERSSWIRGHVGASLCQPYKGEERCGQGGAHGAFARHARAGHPRSCLGHEVCCTNHLWPKCCVRARVPWAAVGGAVAVARAQGALTRGTLDAVRSPLPW